MLRQESSTKISKRAVLIGVVLIIANSYWIAYIEMLWHTAHLTIVTLSVNVMFALLVITGLNIVVRQIAPSAALSRQDLLVIYGMLAVGSAFSGHDCIPRLMGLIPYAFRFATPENDWEALLFRHLPPWLVVSDLRAVTDFFEGEVDFFRDGYYRYWITPILSWSVVIFSLMLIFLCLTSLIRRQWVAHEKLAYPVIQIPLEITADNGAIFKNRLLWMGFGIAAGINLLNGLQYFYPALPSIPVKQYDLNIYFTQKPWSALGSMPLRLHPYMIGLGFILPLDLSFSCAFFYLFGKMQLLYGSMMGIMHLPGYPFFGEQGTGALFALLLITCWSGRKHFSQVISRVFRPDREDEAVEPLSYRATVITLLSVPFGVDGLLYKMRHVDLGMCDFHLHLSADYCWVDTDASGVGPSHSGGRLCHAPIPDNLHVRHAPSPGGESDDALPAELVERGELRIVSDTSDARSDGSVQTR